MGEEYKEQAEPVAQPATLRGKRRQSRFCFCFGLRRKGVRDDYFHRTTICCSRGPDRPSSAGLLLPSVLCLHLGLFCAVLGPATAPKNDFSRRCRANSLGLTHTSYHIGKIRSASLIAQLRALASRRAMVPGGCDRHCGYDVFGLRGRARGRLPISSPRVGAC
jgi:hypothetical protein